MNTFIKTNKTLITYALIPLLVVPIFGINFLMNLIGNIMLLLFLVPLLVLLIIFITFNSLKSKVSTCAQCGTISLGLSNQCMNCGANLDNIKVKNSNINPSDRTIEIKAEEIK